MVKFISGLEGLGLGLEGPGLGLGLEGPVLALVLKVPVLVLVLRTPVLVLLTSLTNSSRFIARLHLSLRPFTSGCISH